MMKKDGRRFSETLTSGVKTKKLLFNPELGKKGRSF